MGIRYHRRMSEYLDYSVSIDFLIKVLASFLCGGVLGVERAMQHKHPGIKTNVLICMGCMGFTHLSATMVDLARMGDPTRVMGQIVTGIGFLAAGSIFVKEEKRMGLTTAAVVWVNAYIGSSIGFGRMSEAVILTLVTVFLIPLVRYFEFRVEDLDGKSRKYTSDSYEDPRAPDPEDE